MFCCNLNSMLKSEAFQAVFITCIINTQYALFFLRFMVSMVTILTTANDINKFYRDKTIQDNIEHSALE